MSALFVLPFQTPFQSSRPLGLAKLYFYRAGTTTHQPVYTTAALSTEHDQPVRSDAAGQFPPIYLNPSADYDYRIQLKTAAEALVDGGDIDNIPKNGFPTQAQLGAILYPRTPAEIAASVVPVNYAYPEGDVRRYGAVGDGSTSDQTAFANCALVGRRFIIPEATTAWQLTDQVSLLDGASVMGAGYLAFVRCSTANKNVFRIAGKTGVSISNVRIRANGSSSGDTVGNGIYHTSCNDLNISNCWIENARNGINGEGANRVNISGCNIQDTVGQYGILHIGSNDVLITGNNIEGTSAMAEAIQFNVNSGTRNKRCIVSNNTIDLSNANTAGPVGISMRYVDDGVMSGNTVHSDTAVNNGIAGVFSLIVNNSTSIAVTGNTCRGGVSPNPSTIAVGINVGDNSEDIAVTGNTVIGATVGIYFNTHRGVCGGNMINGTLDGPGIIATLGVLADTDVNISNNVISGTTGSTAHGIRLELMRGAVLSGNIVRGSDAIGILITDCEDTICTGNNVAECDSDGIQINGSARTLAANNLCFDNNTDGTAGGAGIQVLGASSDNCVVTANKCGNVAGTGDQKYGINISTAGATGCQVHGNDVRSNTTAGISDTSGVARIRNNVGFVTENGGTSAGITTGGTIAHGLAGTPTIFVAVPKAAATDVVVTADGTNLTVTFGGGGTVAFSWEAKLASHYA